MKNELISVIVPCYNVSKYVKKCVNSIINQTYKNLEIILIDDCSTDNTYEILKQLKKSDKRIKIIKNKNNSGLSFSRNVGIKNASGKYIGFIDGDDYIDLTFYEKLYNSIIENKSDIALADMKVVYEDTKMEIVSKCYEGEKFNLLSVLNNGLVASACNKLFKKEIFNDLEFEVGKLNEDIAVIIPALVNAKKLSYVNKTYYYYIQRNGSIQNSSFSDRKFDIFHGVDLTLERIKNNKNYDEIKDILVFNQLITLFLYVIPKEKNKKRRINILKKYNQLSKKYNIRNNKHYIDFLKNSGKKHQIYYKILFDLNIKNHYVLSNNLISLYDMLYKLLKKTVVETNIDLNKIIDAAKKQNDMKNYKTKISVVVPNYNYARFMYQRIYSILSQNYKIYEIIILDDKSTDDSLKVIDEIVSKINKYINIKTIYNEKNSGSAFKQWQKGFEHATGDYVWIAEADDYCEKNLLNSLVKPISKNKNIMISYCDTAFIDVYGNINLKSIVPEIDIQKTGHWNKSYVNNGLSEIKNYSFLNNTIANVSSCIIKNGNYNEILKAAGKYRQAGDWLIYVDIMAQGDISYINKPLNYYRLHGNNVSSTMDHQAHLDELNKLYDYYIKKYKLKSNHKKRINERINFLKKAWKLK